ncbi:MAG: hypothetical protein RBS56_01000 [Candidatus Gracilibacteria bacterium]|jgi:hypothetical protein|nr:hypothetical protein [Candidatus Gracilibacteria bacterium]
MPLDKEIKTLGDGTRNSIENNGALILETQETVKKAVSVQLEVEALLRRTELGRLVRDAKERLQYLKNYSQNKYSRENNPMYEINFVKECIEKIQKLGGDASKIDAELTIDGKAAMTIYLENYIGNIRRAIAIDNDGPNQTYYLLCLKRLINEAKEFGYDVSTVEKNLSSLERRVLSINLKNAFELLDTAIVDSYFYYEGTAESVIKNALEALTLAKDSGLVVDHIEERLPMLLCQVRVSYVKKLIKDLENLTTARGSYISEILNTIEETKKAISYAILAGGDVTDYQLKLSELEQIIKITWANKLFKELQQFDSREIDKHEIQRFGLRWDLRKKMDALSKALISANEAGCDVSEMFEAKPVLFLRLGLKYAKMQVIRFQYFVDKHLVGEQIAYRDILFEVAQAIEAASKDGSDVSELLNEFLKLKTDYQKRQNIEIE